MKEFEDKFGGLQTDIISVSMEYVEDRADKVYVYGSFSEDTTFGNFFYLINNQYVERHKLNDVLEGGDTRYNVSTKRQDVVLEVINDDMDQMQSLCKKHDQPMPTEMRLVYDVKNDDLKADYTYTKDETKQVEDAAHEWFEEIKTNQL